MNTNYWKGLFLLFLLQGCGVGQEVITSAPESTTDPLFTPYTYSATVVDIYDGDTFTLEFDLGFGLAFEEVIRLARVDTPELRGAERPEGIKVRDYVMDLILDKRVIAKTDEDDRGKYGRLITEILFLDPACSCWENLGDLLLNKRKARSWP